jgi:hypothetical protein
MTAGSLGGGHDDQAKKGQAQVGEQGVVGQEVDPGDDDPVEEVEQDAHEGLDRQVVDGPR